jgi:hypothetical protein
VSALVKVVAALGKPAHAREDIAGMPVEEIVRYFATDLIGDRLRMWPDDRLNKTLQRLVAEAVQEQFTDRLDSELGIRRPSWADWMACILLITALITKIYYSIKSLSYDAPRRSDHNDEAFLSRESLSWGRLYEEYVQPCREILKNLKARVKEITESLGPPERVRENLMGTVKVLLERVGNGLTMEEARVELADLHALSEFTWFCLTTVTTEPVYPGWSDLLLDLSNYDSPTEGRIGAPLFQSMTEAQGFIISRYQEVTGSSWDRRVAGEGSEDESFYLAAAELLNAQYRYREAHEEINRPPITTAFVTSFDLELELSLLSLGQPFKVVLPVHFLNKKHSVAHTCWIVLDVKGKVEGRNRERLADLMDPGEGSYRLLDDKWSEAGPVVVRLAGCPLIRLPYLTEGSSLKSELISLFETSLRTEAGEEVGAYSDLIKDKLELQHAVIINEHDAILQGEIDLISIPLGDKRSLRYGLPADWAAGNEHVSRFWMMLGVQIHDSAVRHRVVTLISALPRMATGTPRQSEVGREEAEGRDGPARKIERRGVAVNKYSTELEENLLFWNGFDVVRADVSEFAKDLQHCTAHLDQKKNFTKSGECDVT